MESGRDTPPTETTEDQSSPLMTGFWLGFWSLLLLILGSWFIKTPLIGTTSGPQPHGRVSLFRETPSEKPPQRDLAGEKLGR